MKIVSFKYRDPNGAGWNFSKIPFKSINLLVGSSGSGKTRLLNTIFNLGKMVTSGEVTPGEWEIEFTAHEKSYRYTLIAARREGSFDEPRIVEESLSNISETEEIKIVERTQNKFTFKDSSLPKLDHGKSCISLLKEEEEVKPIFDSFGNILRRDFASLSSAAAPPDSTTTFTIEQITGFERVNNTSENTYIGIGATHLPISSALFLLKTADNDKYNIVIDTYKSIFSTVEDIRIRDTAPEIAGYTPGLEIKERNVENWIPVFDLSSGMKKVLLLLTDIMIIPKGSIYLIDEYENSLGVNAIDFLPAYLTTYAEDKQFIITTHHPYLINNIDIKHWFLFHRDGSNVTISYGDDLLRKYGSSKHQNFTKLINDPLYNGDQ